MKKLLFAIIIILVFSLSISFADVSGYLTEFSDVPTWHWAYETIQKLSSNDIISGYPDGTFKPDKNVSRAEAVKLLMLSLSKDSVFPYGIDVCADVSASHWVSKYLINGKLYIPLYEDNTFKPDEPITRLDFANGVANALYFSNAVLDIDKNEASAELNDISNLDEESQKNIKLLINLGIINGFEDGSFKPNDQLTRAQASKVLSLALTHNAIGFQKKMSQTDGWYLFDSNSGWSQKVQHDRNGNLKIPVGSHSPADQLYYNGEYFANLDKNVLKVKEETLYTNDEEEWTAIFYGPSVVELIDFDTNKYKIINHYQNSEYIFDSNYIPKEEAISALAEEYPYTHFDFILEKDKIYTIEYYSDRNNRLGTMWTNYSKMDENGNIFVNVEDLFGIFQSEELNGNTSEREEFVKTF